MSLKKFLDFITMEIEDKGEGKKPFTDYIIDFFVISIPKAVGKGVSETYSWMKAGVIFAADSITESYKQWHDVRMFDKMYKQKEQGKYFCEKDYRSGEIVCKYSKAFHDKNFIGFFCEDPLCFPNPDVIIKKEGDIFHKGYCACAMFNKTALKNKQ